MNRVRIKLGADYAHAKGLYGNGIGVAILDSGILPHPDFVQNGNRILCFVDFTGEQKIECNTGYFDPAGHGTHVAGILCGDGAASGGKYCGIAPKSHMVCCRILNQRGEGSAETVGAAIHWVISKKNEYGIRILNLSFGSTDNDTAAARELNGLAEEAWDSGLVVIASSGNSGPGPGSVTAPGSAKKVITVGGDAMELRPGRGPTDESIMKPELIAPSLQIMSTSADMQGSSGRIRWYYTKRSGTSMATPMVSGAVAVLLGYRPKLSNRDVKEILKRSAVPYNFPKEMQGWGMVNIRNMLREADRI